MTINERIKEIRKENKLNQKDFGERLGIKQSAASWIEQKNNTVTEQNIMQICSVFHINESWLRTGEGEKYCSDEQDILAALHQKYQLSVDEQVLVKSVLDLSSDDRKTLIKILHRLNERMWINEEEARSAAQVTATLTQEEMALVAAYRKKYGQPEDTSTRTGIGS